MLVIYENPSDFPGKFVVRECGHVTTLSGETSGLWILDTQTSLIFNTKAYSITDTLEEARKSIIDNERNNKRKPIPRSISDDPVIVETWI